MALILHSRLKDGWRMNRVRLVCNKDKMMSVLHFNVFIFHKINA